MGQLKKITSQFIYQVGNFILPLLLIPFLIDLLSPEQYQLLIILQSAVLFFALFINYGFDLKGTKEISRIIENRSNCYSYVKTALYTKFFIFVFSSLFLFIIEIAIFNVQIEFVLSSILWLFAYVFQFNWYFQGKGNFSTITRLGLIPKVAVLSFVFIVVNGDETAYYYLILNALAVFISNFLMCREMYSELGSFDGEPSKEIQLNEIKAILKDGYSVFISQLSTSLISNANVFILPLILSPTSFIVFNTAERLVRVTAMLTTPFTNVLFPQVSRRVHEGKDINRLISMISILSVFVYSSGYGIFLLFGDYFINLIFPSVANELMFYLKFMLIIPLMIFLNNLLGTQIGLNMGQDKYFSRVILVGGISNVSLITMLTYYYSDYGTISAAVSSQVIILIGMYWVAKKGGYEFSVK
ncbi:oligosaccharide flippase family protein [Photobacterium sp.]|uniref:oligosaccharide flippase family protein n=1 Tax=Photobacterium sp. TaxID=660 RepID=UPI00299DFD6A|nr:oligosaccharide flippase family protein [Photobacterium sp.]MDX1303667.1 oligosaccharide flippase family protein [Photobacterium sp.]